MDPDNDAPLTRLWRTAAEHKAWWMTPIAVVLGLIIIGTLVLWKTAAIRYTVF